MSAAAGLGRIARFLWTPLGGWRSNLLWRGYGWATFQLTLMKLLVRPLDIYLEDLPTEFHALTLAGFGLLVFGPRLVLILLAAVSSSLCLATVVLGLSGLLNFPAAEWAIQVALPTVGLVLAFLAFLQLGRRPGEEEWGRFRAEVDWGMTRLARVTVVLSMAFAVLHKLNRDFFDNEVSCVDLSLALNRWWGVPEGLADGISPGLILVLEALVPVLLLAAPRLGVFFTSCLVVHFGSIGATAFSGLILVMAFTFLPASDGPVIRQGLRRRRWWVVATIVLAVVVSLFTYRGPRPWVQFGVYHAVIAAALWASGIALAGEIRRRRARRRGERERGAGGAEGERQEAKAAVLPGEETGGARALGKDGEEGNGVEAEEPAGRPAGSSWPPVRARVVIASIAVLTFLNGMSPYLGLKYELSFAKLSNLRVDDARWNSLVIPRAVRLTEHDSFVHVRRSRLFDRDGQPIDGPGPVPPALYNGGELKRLILPYMRRGYWVGVDFTYRGEEHLYYGGERRRELAAFLTRVPDHRLLQTRLAAEGPQICVH